MGVVEITEESCWDIVGMVEVVVREVGSNVDSKAERERLWSGLIGDKPI